MPSHTIVIIGSSIAGLSAAEAAREKDPDCRIIILSEDSHLPYFRQRLCEVLHNREQAGKLYIHPEDWYQEQGFDLRLNEKVTRVLPAEKAVMLGSGERVPYDSLILASGSYSFLPPTKGFDLTGVETLWTMEDALRIESRIGRAKRSIVIGGGVLGLEAAYALHQRGLESRILERLPRLMMRQLDERSAELFTALVEHEGTHVATQAYIREIIADDEGRAAGMRLEDGSEFPADLILVSAGVRANTEFLSGTGVEVDRMVLVDHQMRTNVPGIFAAGDCAMMDQRWYGLWMIARQQGAVADENAAGGSKEYVMPVPPYMVKTMGTQIASAGTIEEANLSPEALEQLHRDIEENSGLFQYAKRLYVGDTLSGFILMGDTKAFSSLHKQLGKE
ncbi:MAG: FAD-dependent oxidoreductase [Eubacteriales bacterium]|nr:FAD-dependent oxidoreductase [Eubacteriales bacterium]